MRQWLIIDLEATTEEGGWPIEDMEIIEIGASLVAADGHELEHSQRSVPPPRPPYLTDFCREPTHISQSQVDAAQRQVEAITRISLARGLTSLPGELEELARLRLSHPDLKLKELGEMLAKPLSKAGVQHRIARIMQAAEAIDQES